jgi:hypothetical protein
MTVLDIVGKSPKQIGTSLNASVKTLQADHAKLANSMSSRFGTAATF